MVAIRVHPRLFGGPLRAGDLLGACNFLETIRDRCNLPELQLYIPDESVFNAEHCRSMRDFLVEHTNYVTLSGLDLEELNVIPGTDPTYSDMFNIWNIREDVLVRRQYIFDIPDKISIPSLATEDKVVICPIFDAAYNFERNWNLHYAQIEIDTCSIFYKDSEKIICSMFEIPGLDIGDFVYSHDFESNLEHIRTARIYIGGDTFSSHFAGSLSPGPERRIYHYSKHTYGTTNPLNWKKNGHIV